MKQIIAWVNKSHEKQLKGYSNLDIYFASIPQDFESHLTSSCFPILSTSKAGLYSKVFDNIILNHPNLVFYFIEVKNKPLTLGEINVRWQNNVYNPMLPVNELVDIFNS
jgi:hypothetical protein